MVFILIGTRDLSEREPTFVLRRFRDFYRSTTENQYKTIARKWENGVAEARTWVERNLEKNHVIGDKIISEEIVAFGQWPIS